MRQLFASATTTATVLFSLDAVLAVLTWPLVIWMGRPDPDLLFTLSDPRGVLYLAANLITLYAMGLYRRDALMETARSLTRVPLVVGMGATAAVLASMVPAWLFGSIPPIGGRDQAMVFALATVNFTLCAFAARVIVSIMIRRRMLRRRLLVLGSGERAWDLLRMLTNEGTNLHYDLTFLHHPSMGALDPRLVKDPAARILRSETFDVLRVASRIDPDQIVVAPDERRGMDLERLLECKKAGFPIIQYLTFVEKEIRRIDLKRMELGWLVYSDGFVFGIIDRVLKRIFDLVISSVVLVVTSPLLLAGMVAVRWEGPGPVLYRQERVTRNERVFWIMKLRTMRVDAEKSGAVWAAAKDTRITRVGAFLRRTRIDELPQLINILKGDMSFVGPRPERPVFVAELASQIPLYHERHMVKAGLTGWAQINYPYGASIDDARSKLSYDLYYTPTPPKPEGIACQPDRRRFCSHP